MINISYRRNDNVIYSFFTRYPLDNDFEYNWYCKLFGHFKNIYIPMLRVRLLVSI